MLALKRCRESDAVMLRPCFAGAEAFVRELEKPVALKATLRYGIGAHELEGLDVVTLDKAVAEMRNVSWEFALVSRRDEVKGGRGGFTVEDRGGAGGGEGCGALGGGEAERLVRELVVSSARGVRRYHICEGVHK